MLFDAYAALRKLESEPVAPATTATTATKSAQTPTIVANVAVVAATRGQKSEKPPRTDEASPYGRGVGGGQLTWTGKVVSLADWRNLNEWERHGSTGKMWNGLTQSWEAKP